MKEITFLHPGFFWLLLLLPLAVGWYWLKKKEQSATLRISAVDCFRTASSWKSKLKPVLFGMRLLALACMIVALARPRTPDVTNRVGSIEGIDIVMAMDVSTSMLARDLKPNRFEALKKVAADFVDARVNDRIGLVVYAGESYTKIPVTSDKPLVKQAINSTSFETLMIEDGTAIGTGLATAVNRLKESKAKSRIIILLTDGVNNGGVIDPATAADIAKEYKIKVYTIGIGTNGMAEYPMMRMPDGSILYDMQEVRIDEDLLKTIAKKTGGKYFRATTNSRLQEIYKEIDKLETSELPETKYFNYKEKFRIFVWAAFGLLLLEAVARRTFYRSII
jgi:Ca-activated chloride channel family protein